MINKSFETMTQYMPMNHIYVLAVLLAVLYLGRARFVSKETLSSTTTYYRIFKLNLIVVAPLPA